MYKFIDFWYIHTHTHVLAHNDNNNNKNNIKRNGKSYTKTQRAKKRPHKVKSTYILFLDGDVSRQYVCV